MKLQSKKCRYLLYAEDDPDDQQYLLEVMQEIDPTAEVKLFNNGLELIVFLKDLRPEMAYPCCIILDINMPIWDGLRTLKAITADRHYRNIPVIMFSTSVSEADRQFAANAGARAYMTKSYQRTEFESTIRSFIQYFEEEIPQP